MPLQETVVVDKSAGTARARESSRIRALRYVSIFCASVISSCREVTLVPRPGLRGAADAWTAESSARVVPEARAQYIKHHLMVRQYIKHHLMVR